MLQRFLPILFVSLLGASEHIILPEFDNMMASSTSATEILVNNLMGTFSTKTYKIGKKVRKLKCSPVRKIRCGGGYTPKINLSLRQTPTLRETTTNKLVDIFETKIIFESKDANFWNVCGGAVGGLMWDKINLVSPSADKFTVNYSPLSQEKIFYYFTNDSAKGSNKSYMVIKAEQVCK